MIRTFEVELKVLTPLHIRAGSAPLNRDWDYIVTGNTAYVLDNRRIYSELWDSKSTPPTPAQLLRGSQVSDYTLYTLRIAQIAAPPERIWPITRDINGRPYVPGSSIKGLLRTAIIWKLYQPPLQLDDGQTQAKSAGAKMEKTLMGQEPHRDILRALRVSDFQLLGEAQSWLFPFELLTLDRNGRLRSITGNKGGWEPLEAVGNGATFRGTISIDEHLLQNPAAQRELHLSTQAVQLVYSWADVLSEFGKALLNYQIGFFRRCFEPDLANLLGRISQVRIPACLGWGGGWPSKTVGLKLGPQEIAQVQRHFKMNRWISSSFPDNFPASRRMVRTPKGLRPLGWVEVSIIKAQ
jgi:CRISPR-associated protein Csm5